MITGVRPEDDLLTVTLPLSALPGVGRDVVARIGVDLDPVDVTDADDARRLHACLWPEREKY